MCMIGRRVKGPLLMLVAATFSAGCNAQVVDGKVYGLMSMDTGSTCYVSRMGPEVGRYSEPGGLVGVAVNDRYCSSLVADSSFHSAISSMAMASAIVFIARSTSRAARKVSLSVMSRTQVWM